MRLAVSDVVGGDQLFWQGQAGGADADFGEGPRAGGNNGPTIWRKTGQQGECAGEWKDALKIGNFAAFDFAVLGFVICVRKIFADGGEAGASVGAGHNFPGVEAALDGPLTPDAGDGGSGVYQDSVHVE